ncbi:MAG: hypothetical protein NC420_15860 [Eubacterium sp.]|nr:hypothetical protein [Eubacterium sp.]MCM1219247.1 hypothetical protein [Lachnospiraceae bacterium]MCM1305405.1 hypothetical protein [Butyrivibrio sp.]MCM1345105.1 hypothetical protein [Muribaculaceae bacterium]MCM1241035.1 hypothetical protein [Lachnospiraceae bacterium]
MTGRLRPGMLWEERHMGVRSIGYDNDILDEVLCYFMKTILNLQETGIEKLPVENRLPEPVRSYMDLAVRILIGGQPPETSQLILQAEYDVLLNREKPDIEMVISLQMVKELSCHIRFDQDCYEYLLSTVNLWGNRVFEYASLTFYPNLPAEIRQKYGIDDLIRYIPRERLRLEDY